MHAVLLCGIQGSGKSTFYREHFADTHARINLDTLKTRGREDALVQDCIRAKRPFVVDNTNATVQQRARFITAARRAGYRITAYDFDIGIDQILARNKARPEKERVPMGGIFGTRKRFQIPSLSEGIDELFKVSADDNGVPTIQSIAEQRQSER